MNRIKGKIRSFLLLSARSMHNTYNQSLNGYAEALIVGGGFQILAALFLFEGVTVQVLLLAFITYVIWHHFFVKWAERYLEKHGND